MGRVRAGVLHATLAAAWLVSGVARAGDTGAIEAAIGPVAGRPRRTGRAAALVRLDGADVLCGWAKPPEGLDPSLADIAVHYGGAIHYRLSVPAGGSRRLALALCEGWWDEPGRRMEVLRVEGAEPVTVDAVARIGKNRAAAFWFDGRDRDGDGAIDIRVEAAETARDENTILSGLWAFEAGTPRRDDALLEGRWNDRALARLPLLDDGAGYEVALLSGREALERLRAIHEATVERMRAAVRSAACRARPAFLPLPPGEVRPAGWLEDWARSAARGITGHLDERAAVFASGYTGSAFKALGARPDGTGWPVEQCAYWLDGLVRLAYVLGDERLIRKAVSRLERVVEGVNGGGESLIYWRPRSILEDTFNSWGHSHMGRALVAYYEATADPRVLRALVKAYRGYPLPELRADLFAPVSGAVNLDPLLDTYALSADESLLETALEYARRPAFARLVQRWAGGDIPVGHGVIYYENLRVPALLYPWTGQARMLEASREALEYGVEHHGLPFGPVSSEEFLAGVGSTRHVETCNVSAGSWTQLWLLRLTGERVFADRIERIFFNATPAAVSRDFETVAYFQCANQMGVFPVETPGPGGSRRFDRTAGRVLCCVGNLNRALPSYIEHMWLATPEGGLAAALYGPCRLRTLVGGVPVVIDCRTRYPFEPSIDMTMRVGEPVRFPLELRLPGWCRSPRIEVGGRAIPLPPSGEGFARVERLWSDGDRIAIHLPMRARIGRGHETPFPPESAEYFRGRALSKRRDVRAPFAAVSYGPLLMALPIPDETPNRPAPSARWGYALDVAPGRAAARIEEERRPLPERWRWQLEGAPIRLRVPARELDWRPTALHPLPEAPVAGKGAQEATITLVPYGCTKFRVSMFPVTRRAWGEGAR